MSTTPVELPLRRPDPLTAPPAHEDLRRASPVTRVSTPYGPALLVTAAEVAVTALADPRLGISPPGVEPDVRASLFCDGPAHARLRRLVAAAFRPVRIAQMRPRLEALAEQYVQRVVAAGPPCDLIDALAAPLPIAVIAEMVGIPVEQHPRFRALVEAALDLDPVAAAGDPELAEAAGAAWEALGGFVSDLVAARRDAPADDLLGDLIAVRDTDDGRLCDDELVALVQILVAAGTLTVRNGVALAVLRLLAEGSLRDLAPAVDGADGTVGAVVEEVVRRAAIEPFPRFAHTDLELGGVAVACGEMVLVSLEAANHDPARFADPECFRPGRPEAHLGFGHGPHYCLGAALARAELAAVLPVLARRLPDLRLEVPLAEVPWRHALIDGGPVTLPVGW